MSVRTERVGEVIREEIANMLLRGEIRDPALHNRIVSITGVEVNRDLHYSTAFVTVMGDEKQLVMAALNRAAGFIRTQLGHRLRLRFTPQIQFTLDETLENARRMDALLASLHIPELPPSEQE